MCLCGQNKSIDRADESNPGSSDESSGIARRPSQHHAPISTQSNQIPAQSPRILQRNNAAVPSDRDEPPLQPSDPKTNMEFWWFTVIWLCLDVSLLVIKAIGNLRYCISVHFQERNCGTVAKMSESEAEKKMFRKLKKKKSNLLDFYEKVQKDLSSHNRNLVYFNSVLFL